MDKRFLAILAVIVVAFAGVLIFSNHKNNPGASNSSAQPTNHVEGQGKSGVTLVEYGDYECPICEEYYLPLKAVASDFNKQIYFQFRNLPLTSIHPNAFAGARAAEAASLQGKFWQMHDALYDNQSSWVSASDPQSDFDSYAQALGLNLTKFNQDYTGAPVNDSIETDLNAFSKTGQQQATPTFFLDGKYLDDSQLGVPNSETTLDLNATVANFAKFINAEIAAKAKS